jgi:tetratricopeptide (TPR) repeat protein
LIYRLSEQDEQAVAEYKRAISLVENTPQLHAKLADYYAALGDALVDANQLSKAAEAYQNAIRYSTSLEIAQQYQVELDGIKDQIGSPY